MVIKKLPSSKCFEGLVILSVKHQNLTEQRDANWFSRTNIMPNGLTSRMLENSQFSTNLYDSN